MTRKLSIFFDESGDLGPVEAHSPFYILGMVFHNQSKDISEALSKFDAHLATFEGGFHAVHTGPLIRRERPYVNMGRDERRKIFRSLFNLARKLDIKFGSIVVDKRMLGDKLITDTLNAELRTF